MSSHLVHPDPDSERFDALAQGAATGTLAALATVVGTLALGMNDTLAAWVLVAGTALPAGLVPIGRWRWSTRRAHRSATGGLDPDQRTLLASADAAVARLAAAAEGAAPGPVADHLARLDRSARAHLVPIRRSVAAAPTLPADARRALLDDAAERVRGLHRLARSAEQLRRAQADQASTDELVDLAEATDAITAALTTDDPTTAA